MSQKPETLFRKRVRDDLKRLHEDAGPIFFEPIQQKAICGSPDFFLCIQGLFIALELKAANGVLSGLQEEKLRRVGLAGGMAVVTDPTNWLLVLETLYHLAIGEKNSDKTSVHNRH